MSCTTWSLSAPVPPLAARLIRLLPVEFSSIETVTGGDDAYRGAILSPLRG
jgi:hypothetical protein